ncbi:hypothetical protein ABFX02_07G059100 [Erythranthe guttata]
MATKKMLLVFLVVNTIIPIVFPLTLYDWQILIRNESRSQNLTTHCITNNGGEDVGIHTLQPTWKEFFVCHVLVKKRSLASCDMSMGNSHVHLDVYDSDRDSKRCSGKTCIWDVNDDGLFLEINGQRVLQYRWS